MIMSKPAYQASLLLRYNSSNMELWKLRENTTPYTFQHAAALKQAVEAQGADASSALENALKAKEAEHASALEAKEEEHISALAERTPRSTREMRSSRASQAR